MVVGENRNRKCQRELFRQQNRHRSKRETLNNQLKFNNSLVYIYSHNLAK